MVVAGAPSAWSARRTSRRYSRQRAMAEPRAYIRDGAEIYRRSFAIIRAESDLARFTAAEERVAVRIIHACGMTEIARDIVMSPGFAERARMALLEGAPVLCDSKMVANGITRARLPKSNPIVCTIDDPAVPGLAQGLANTRTAAAMDLWRGPRGRAGGGPREAPGARRRCSSLLRQEGPAGQCAPHRGALDRRGSDRTAAGISRDRRDAGGKCRVSA